MLGILSIVSLVVGAFVAGGGAFDWQFLFSDGYREHNWVRSVGRDGARGLLVLFGGVLIVVGFVGQVVDAAAKPVAVTANDGGTLESTDELPPANGPTAGSHSMETGPTGHPKPSKGPAVAGPSLQPMTSPTASHSHAPSRSAAAADNPPPPAPGEHQPMTIWNPETELEEDGATIWLQYRFEPGHEPVAGAKYFWLIAFPDKDTEVEDDTMDREGRRAFFVELPKPEQSLKRWSTTVWSVESDGKKKQVSNRLEINNGEVRSTPLAAPR
jgi:hypothetical protein